MKKIINDPRNVVDEMLDGMASAHSQIIERIENSGVIVRKEKKKDKVALISGGGSGHEPSHAGYVGKGMLDAAVAGEVFTSPTPDQIGVAIDSVKNEAGILLVVKNYSGDVMNFEMAAEMAEMENVKVATVVVNDDVAVENSTYTTGRRGIAGTVFVHKIAGALAERGAPLEDVHRVALKVVENLRSKGMALAPCTVPAVGKPGFELNEDEMEIGLGIHGEPGVKKTAILPAEEIAGDLCGSVIEDLPFNEGDEIAIMVNGLGGTPLMELYILEKAVSSICTEKGLKVHRTFVGNYMTSLEMAGASVSFLKLDDQMKDLLDDPSLTASLVQPGKVS